MPGHRVILTRSPGDNTALATLLAEQGLVVESYPCVSLEAVTPSAVALTALSALGPLAGVAFTSRRGVKHLLEQPAILDALGLTPALLIGAVGPATATALEDRGWTPQLVARPATGAALCEAFVKHLAVGSRVLIPGGDRPRPELPDALNAAGLDAVPLRVYAHAELTPEPLSAPPPAVVVCASPSAAETFVAANPALAGRGAADLPTFVAIGPTTARSLDDLGIGRLVQARGTGPAALAAAVNAALEQAPQTPQTLSTNSGD